MRSAGGPENGAPVDLGDWAGPDGALGRYVVEASNEMLGAYRSSPTLIREHERSEVHTAEGGYADRQILELVQNSADALVDAEGAPESSGRVVIRLTDRYLYCADSGTEITPDGVKALLFRHLSPKGKESEIGRFGLGFKAVLGVSDAPEFFSRSGSFRFDRERTAARIREVIPGKARSPALRLADPVEPGAEAAKDETLAEFMTWARNIVRLPLLAGVRERLSKQMRDFPAPFLLFVEQVRSLTLEGHDPNGPVELEVERDGKDCRLGVNGEKKSWVLFKDSLRLTEKAFDGRRRSDGDTALALSWAFPYDRKERETYRHFWAYFPTRTASLVPGILNAPWKTNEDRQNLLPGDFNRELIENAADLIVKGMMMLRTDEDPSRHLDAFPRRHLLGDSEESERISKCLSSRLRNDPIVPDQKGILRRIEALRYPPKAPTKAWERWADCEARPTDWPHPSVARGNRLAKIEHLWLYRRERAGTTKWATYRGRPSDTRMQTASLREWLEALFEKVSTPADSVEASRAAVRVAALMPRAAASELGKIVLTASGRCAEPDPEVLFLPASGEAVSPTSSDLVHPELAGKKVTRTALEELGLGAPPADRELRVALTRLTRGPGEDEAPFDAFWASAREVLRTRGIASVKSLLREFGDGLTREHLRVRVESGRFRPVDSVLLPGPIVVSNSAEDADAVVDLAYHAEDRPLLDLLGAVEQPEFRELGEEPCCRDFRSECEERFISSCREEGRGRPQKRLLEFKTTRGVGPLQVLGELGERARVRYTAALLEKERAYVRWTMRHATKDDRYPEMQFEAPALRMIEREGRLPAGGGSARFADALGARPGNEDALRCLLGHPYSNRIRRAFVLADLAPQAHGEEEPERLLERWPGLTRLIPGKWADCRLRRCERIVGASEAECVLHDGDIYLVPSGDEVEDLRRVVETLGQRPAVERLRRVVEGIPQEEVERLREDVRAQDSDEERLITAVGVDALRKLLPESLVSFLGAKKRDLSPLVVAEAAISRYHTETLQQCRKHLGRLEPPPQWAGSGPAVAFVESLGFSAEWAGERNEKREPHLDVEGGFRLPRLHRYQKGIVRNIRAMLREGKADPGARRGMISLPTGSGKTRVAVQAVVRALVRKDLRGGVLWVADRDELCEQAVEAWQQVWSAKGAPGTTLRISRLWGGQPDPSRTSDLHVIVASIQTLRHRLRRRLRDYPFLRNFRLVVFDEAHRSLAPTYTSAMEELGLKYRRKRDEPFLLGLTATPYRGADEAATNWLKSRYGGRRLDFGVFPSDGSEEVVRYLQNEQVLAEADHETIDGVTLKMTPEEERALKALPSWLPEQLEKRIGRDSERTERIVDAFLSRRRTAGPTLIFATSVEHADTVSAILNLRGIRARAVNGKTNRGTRRRIVEEFRARKIRVLVNYGVFREGFDAPKTRTIIVARPVYSPNLYFQMIGRGLRGVKNGGNERCLILNVDDNIVNFKEKLAFTELDWLWADGARRGRRRSRNRAAEA